MGATVTPTASAQAPVVSSVAGQAPTAATATAAAKGAGVSAQAKSSSHGGGVLGAKAELASATKHLGQGGVGDSPQGFPMALGLALIAGGYGLRRKAGALS